jgi:outer membrane immunogenic protein
MRKMLFLSSAAALLGAVPAFAADLPSRRTEPVAPTTRTMPPVFTWTGLYAGANVGWNWSQGDATLHGGSSVLGLGTSVKSDNKDGVTGGGQVGYNWQYDQFVFGAEGDFNYIDTKHSRTFSTAGVSGLGAALANGSTISSKMNWLGTARARLGVAYDRFLIYGTGGFAYADVEDRATVTTTIPVVMAFQSNGGKSDTRFGWTIGGGVEYAFMNNWSTKVEYLYYKLENKTYAVSGAYGSLGTLKSKPEGSILRAGLNYRFSTY